MIGNGGSVKHQRWSRLSPSGWLEPVRTDRREHDLKSYATSAPERRDGFKAPRQRGKVEQPQKDGKLPVRQTIGLSHLGQW